MTDALLSDVRRHDAALRELGLVIWLGAEPTFSRRDSQEPWWLHQAEGGDKEAAARSLLLALAPRLSPRTEVFRAKGRQYPGEDAPRFCYGALFHRAPAAGAGEPMTPAASELNGAALDGPAIDQPKPDSTAAWLTVTPDPGVVEVNMAPAHELEAFLGWSRAVYAAAAEAGLSPLRWRYNGQLTDSGGGGQITLGGPTPEQSPFFVHAHLLPGLLRYLNRHPSLSYAFSTECLGSASQGPRPDEGVRERFEELAVALDLLASRGAQVSSEELWNTLAPLLVDGSGNSHRAEVNIEKLFNPHFGVRGKLGLVELRSLGMAPTPERLTALAVLWRALAARLIVAPYREPLADWGSALHDRFALPHFLARDLREVLADLDAHGLGLGPAISAALLEPRPVLARLDLGPASLEVSRALEFWPLLGDVASQERQGARLVDASTERVQLLVRVPCGAQPGAVAAGGREVPLVFAGSEGAADVYAAGIRFRAFVPRPGLHPGLGAHDPLSLAWTRAGATAGVDLHAWIPGGGAYPGLPVDAAEAELRRRQRVVLRADRSPVSTPGAGRTAGPFTMDLRRTEPIGFE